MRVWVVDANDLLGVEMLSALEGAGFAAFLRSHPDNVTPVKGDLVIVNLDTIPHYNSDRFAACWEITHSEDQTNKDAILHRPFDFDDLAKVVAFFDQRNLSKFPLFCTHCGKSIQVSDVRIVRTSSHKAKSCPDCDLPNLAESGSEFQGKNYLEAV